MEAKTVFISEGGSHTGIWGGEGALRREGGVGAALAMSECE